MIIGVGIDIVDLDRIRRAYERFGDRFCKHVLDSSEIADMPAVPIAFIGSRFAAKEAAVKALGTGFSRGITPQMLVIFHDKLGRPKLIMRENALSLAARLGVKNSHLSISHERGSAIAIVILED